MSIVIHQPNDGKVGEGVVCSMANMVAVCLCCDYNLSEIGFSFINWGYFMRIFWLLWLFFLSLGVAWAEPINHVLWKVEKVGQPVSYLLGTLHINKTAQPLDATVRDTLAKVDVLLTESQIPANAAEASSIEWQQAMMSTVNINNTQQLASELGAVRYQKIQQYFQNNASLRPLLPMLPHQHGWAALMYISSASPEGFSQQYGVDFQLNQLAAQQGIQRDGLETLPESMAIFREVERDKMGRMIDSLLAHEAENARDVAKMVDLYNHQQIAQLVAWSWNEQQTLKYVPKMDKAYWRTWFYDVLLKERNRRWLGKIEQYLSQKPTLIAVGLLHLPKENGLIALLRARGYTITAVR